MEVTLHKTCIHKLTAAAAAVCIATADYLHCRGDYNAALAAIVDALPLQTRQTVIAHCRWHADLCELDMRK